MPAGFDVFNQKRAIRSAPNPHDKSSIVSIYPRKVVHRNWTIEPGLFPIDAGSYDNPAILVVNGSSWWKEIHAEKTVLEIPTGSALIAESVVSDWCKPMQLVTELQGPGMFIVPGLAVTTEQVKTEYKDKLDFALERQRRWYQELIVVADLLWVHSNGNPRSVDALAKLAARELGIKDKGWMMLEQQSQLVACPACGTMRNPAFPVCANCHTIVDKARYESLGLEKAV